MKKETSQGRRGFLKAAGAGTAGIAFASIVPESMAKANAATRGWPAIVSGAQVPRVNPAIPNEKVVCCYDRTMLKTQVTPSSFSEQNSTVNTAKVEANMDSMAMNLTGTASANAAWDLIFRKPASKEWPQVKAAIKVNSVPGAVMPHTAVVGKVCKELIRLQVPPANITLFDTGWGENGHGASAYSSSIGNGVPANVVVSTASRVGGNVPVGNGFMPCSHAIAQVSGTTVTYVADILINCAVNKGHQDQFGGFTMLMKNHTGTLKFTCPSASEIIDENKSEAIIGMMGDSAIPPRQQLCIIDSLWSVVGGPEVLPSGEGSRTCRIVMGTVAPVVDYLTAEKIRKPSTMMNAAYNTGIVDNWLSSFGIEKAACQWVEIGGATEVHGMKSPGQSHEITVAYSSAGRTQTASLAIPRNGHTPTIRIIGMNGRVIRELSASGASTRFTWDGASQWGLPVGRGRYVVEAVCGPERSSAMLMMD